MIEDVRIRKAHADGRSFFVVGYFDLEKKKQKGYFRTTKYGSETQVRGLLRSCGVSNAQIDQLFEGFPSLIEIPCPS